VKIASLKIDISTAADAAAHDLVEAQIHPHVRNVTQIECPMSSTVLPADRQFSHTSAACRFISSLYSVARS